MADEFDDNLEYTLPSYVPEFEFMEVNNTISNAVEKDKVDEDMEYMFPLFSTNPTIELNVQENEEKKERESLRNQLIVSLRDATDDIDQIILEHNFKQSNAKFGRTICKDSSIQEYQLMAVEYETIFAEKSNYNDLKSNSTIEILSSLCKNNSISKNKKKVGKRQREAKKVGQQRELERKEKAIEMKKIIKKKFHKRGGKRNANKAKSVNTVVKFGTE
ncbi:hypothetical protein QEN19_000787 [Hanseniaspora menglaensis]